MIKMHYGIKIREKKQNDYVLQDCGIEKRRKRATCSSVLKIY